MMRPQAFGGRFASWAIQKKGGPPGCRSQSWVSDLDRANRASTSAPLLAAHEPQPVPRCGSPPRYHPMNPVCGIFWLCLRGSSRACTSTRAALRPSGRPTPRCDGTGATPVKMPGGVRLVLSLFLTCRGRYNSLAVASIGCSGKN